MRKSSNYAIASCAPFLAFNFIGHLYKTYEYPPVCSLTSRNFTMSLHPSQMSTIQTPATYLVAEHDIPVVITSDSWNEIEIQADSYSTNDVQFNVTPPANTLVGRHWRVRFEVTVTAGTDTGATGGTVVPFNESYDAPTALPMHASLGNATLTLNGASTARTDCYRLMPTVYSSITPEDQITWLSSTPNVLDRAANFVDVGIGAGSPFAARGGRVDGVSRAEFPYEAVAPANDVTLSRKYQFTMPVHMSPLSSSPTQAALAHIQTANLTLQFNDMASRIWSHNKGTGPTPRVGGVTVSLASAPVLILDYMVPSLDANIIPSEVHYPHTKTLSYAANTPTTIATGAVATLYSTQINLAVWPRTLYAYVIRDSVANGDTLTEYTQAVCSVTGIQVSDGIHQNLLRELSAQGIYEMSRASGNTQGAVDFMHWTGGVVAIDTAQFLPRAGTSPGQQGSYQLSVTLNVKNQTAGDFIGRLVVVTETEGSCILSPGRCQFMAGSFNAVDRANALLSSEPIDEFHSEDVGGGFSGMMKRVSRRVKGRVKRFGKSLSSIARVADKVASPLLAQMGPEGAAAAAALGTARTMTREGSQILNNKDTIGAIHQAAALAGYGGGVVGGGAVGGSYGGGLIGGGLIGGSAGQQKLLRMSMRHR
jgi:hypothetical protein